MPDNKPKYPFSTKEQIGDYEFAIEDITDLLRRRAWFEVMPLPDDQYRITTKSEPKIKLSFNWDGLQTAHDEIKGTTFFGGSFTINGLRFQVSGTDRDGGLSDCITRAIEMVIGRKLTTEEDAGFEYSGLYDGDISEVEL